jgi:hypothetical protein
MTKFGLLALPVAFFCGAAFSQSNVTSPNPAAAPVAVADSARGDASIKSHLGSVQIQTEPETATVIIDSTVRGTTPLRIDQLQEGRHFIILRKEGYYVKKGEITIMPDSLIAYTFQLTKPASLVITSTPPGASIALNGKIAGVAPYENRKLKPGEYEITAALPGYDGFKEKVTLGSGQTDTLNVILQKAQQPKSAAAASSGKSVGKIIVLTVFALFGLGLVLAEFMSP